MTALRLSNRLRFGRGEWLALGAAITYGVSNTLTRVGATQGDALAGSIVRLLPLVLMALGMMAWRPKHAVRLLAWRPEFVGWRDIGWLTFYSLVVTPLSQLSIFLALRFGGVLVAVSLFSTFPLFGALIAIRFLGQAFNRRIGAGIVTCLLGITLLTLGQYSGRPFSPLWPVGAVCALLAGLTWGTSANLSGHLLRRGLDVYTLLVVTTVTAVVVLSLGLTAAGGVNVISAFRGTDLWTLLAAGLLNGLAQAMLWSAFGLTTVASAGAIKTLDAVIASAIAVSLLGEVINVFVALGIAFIVGGVIVVQLARRAEGRQSHP